MKRKLLVTSVLAAAALTLGACGSSNSGLTSSYAVDQDSYDSYDGSYAEADSASDYNGLSLNRAEAPAMEESLAVDDGSVSSDGSAGAVDSSATASGDAGTAEDYERKLVKTEYLNVETEDLVSFDTELQQQVKGAGGYIESQSMDGGVSLMTDDEFYDDGTPRKRTPKYASYSIRIPAANLDSFVANIESKTNVLSQNSSVDDITLNYIDIDSQRKSLEIEQENLMRLLESAETVEDMITIESRLSDVRSQLQSINSQLRYMDNQVSYATVSLNVSEVEIYSPVEEESAGQRMSRGLAKSWNTFVENIEKFAIGFVVNLPFIIFWVIIIVILILIIRLIVRKCRKNAEKRADKRAARQRADQLAYMQQVQNMQAQAGYQQAAQGAQTGYQQPVQQAGYQKPVQQAAQGAQAGYQQPVHPVTSQGTSPAQQNQAEDAGKNQ